MNLSKILATLALVPFAVLAPKAMAWDGSFSGQITQFEISATGNMGFRVYQYASGPMCGAGTQSWSFLEETDSNYKAFQQSLWMAKLLGKPPLVYTTKVGIYCHIGDIVLPLP